MAKVFVVTSLSMVLSVNKTLEGAMKAANIFIGQSDGWIVEQKDHNTSQLWRTIRWHWKNKTLETVQQEMMLIREKNLDE